MRETPSRVEGLSATYRICLLVGFVGDLVLPILNLFVPLLAYELGANPFEVGLVGGVSYVTYSLVPFVVGRFSDRMKQRSILLIISLLVLCSASALYAIATSPVFLIALRVVEGVCWGILWPTVDALVGGDPSRETTRSFSVYNSTWSTASAIGPLVGTAIAAITTSIRFIFVSTALLSGAMVLLNIVSLVRTSSHSVEVIRVATARPAGHASDSEADQLPSRHLRVGRVGFMMVAIALVMASRSTIFTFFPPLARSMGLSVFSIGLIAFASGLMMTLVFVATTRDSIRNRILERNRTKANVLIVLSIASIAGALPGLQDNTGTVGLVSFGLVGAATGIMITLAQAGIIVDSKADQIGRSSGLFESAIGIGSAFGPVFAGSVSGTSFVLPFLTPLLGIVAVPVLLRLYHEDTRLS
ncbi:MAG: MFS transporter [Nitrososphaerales archaeon]